MTFFKTLDNMKVFHFSFLVQRYKSVKKILKPCWSVKKILNHSRASRIFAGRFYSINQDLHFVILNVFFLKMTFFKTLDDMKVFYFSFIVQRYKSVKKILKPAGASRKFEALLERQENFEAY